MTREARDLKRNVRVDTDIAILGDAQGNTTQHLPLGLIRVRRRTGAGLGTVEIIRAFGGSAYPLLPGCEVHIGRDLGGRLAVLGATYEWMVANGFDPNYLNSGNPRYDWVDLRNAIPLRSAATQPPSLKASLWPLRWIDHDKVVHEFPGANLDISSDIPAVGNHGLIVTYIKSDDTADYTASTPKALPESVNPIVLADIQECVTAAPDDAIWSGIWHVKNDQGQVTANDLYDDLRQWINVPGTGTPDLSDAVILAPDSDTRNDITAGANDQTALRLKPFSSGQTANLFEVVNSAGSLRAAIDLEGRVRLRTLSMSVTVGATISANTVSATHTYMRISSGASNELHTLAGGADGQIIFLRASTGDTVILKHGAGNLVLADGQDQVLSGNDHIALVRQDVATTVWIQFSRSLAVKPTSHGGTGADNSGSTRIGGIPIKTAATTIKVVHTPLLENVLLNSDFTLAADATSVASAASGAHICEIWRMFKGGTTAVVNLDRDTDVPTVAQAGRLILNSLKIDFPTGDASMDAGDFVIVRQAIEGYRFARMLAQRPMLAGFWVKSDITGTLCSFVGNNVDRTFITEHVINAANTWEFKLFLIPASPSAGTWNYANGIGLNFGWALMAGSNFQGAGGSWQSSSIFATSNQTNFAAANNNTVWVTAPELVCLDSPDVVDIPVRVRDFGEEKRLLERYYWKHPGGDANSVFGWGFNATTTIARALVQFPAQMRAVPSFDSGGSFQVAHGASTTAVTSLSTANITVRTANIGASVASGLTVGQGSSLRAASDANAYIAFDARL